MKFKCGDVVRIAYKWPHEMKNPDGEKYRPAVVVAIVGNQYFVSPMTTKEPDALALPHALPVKPTLQRQLGLPTGKPSWVFPHHINRVELPNSSLIMTSRPGKQATWTYGEIPKGMLELIDEKRFNAIKLDQHKIQKIDSDDIEQTREALRRGQDPSVARSAPGPGRDRSGLQADVHKRAAERQNRSVKDRKPQARKKGHIQGAD